MRCEESDLNEVAFRRLEQSIKQQYPHGQYVALVGGDIVADAADFGEVQAKLKAAGRNPRQAFIVRAGHVYPKHATIL